MPPMPKKPTPGSKKGPNRNLLIALVAGAAVVAAVVIGGLLLGGGDESVDVSSVAHLEGIPQTRDVLGNPDAAVTLITFEDIQCPVCQAWTEEGQADVITEYVAPGDVKMRFAGLAFLGADSEKALRYALAAGEQGQLWQYTELLYANQGPENSGWVSDDLLEQLATALGLDWAQLQEDADSGVVRQQITSMNNEAAQKQVQGTPTFFVQVGDDEAYQVQPTSFSVESFRPILDDALDAP